MVKEKKGHRKVGKKEGGSGLRDGI